MEWLLIFFKLGEEPRDIPFNECKRNPALCAPEPVKVQERRERQRKFTWDPRRSDR